MPRVLAPLYSLNAGEVSKLALARLDLQKMRIAGEKVINWLPTILGPMMFRPGLESMGDIPNTSTAVPAGFAESDCSDVSYIDFVASASDTAAIELTPGQMRVWLRGETLISRPAVTATVTNGDFASLAGWTTISTGGATAFAVAGGVQMTAPAQGGRILLQQAVTTASPNIEHALRIVVTRGPVRLSVGTTAGGVNLVAESTLAQGTHSIAFTPTSSPFHIQLEADSVSSRLVASCQIEAAGPMVLTTPYDRVALRRLTHVQSIDVVFVAAGRVSPRRIERRGTRSWSIVEYFANGGPLLSGRTARVKLTPSNTTGIITLTASGPLFRAGHVGATFRLFHPSQSIYASLAGSGEFSPPIRINGVGADRTIVAGLSNTWVGTITAQKSLDGPDTGFIDVAGYTGNFGPVGVAVGGDNSIVWFRYGFKEANYTSGQCDVQITSGSGGGEGFCRILSVISPTQATAEVTSRLYGASATDNWQEGRWSGIQGYPSGVSVTDGRLFWGASDQYAGSVSDAYDNFNLSVQGESAPVIRSIATGPSGVVQWMLSLQRLIIGTNGAEVSVRSSAFDAPLTATDNTARNASSYGSAPMPAVAVDRTGIFISKDERSAIEIAYSVDAQDYASKDLTELNPDLMAAKAIDIAVQRHPDTRIWFVLKDGSACCLTYERANEVVAWSQIETNGLIKGVCVLPAPDQDRVFFAVQRANGLRFERMAMDSEARGGPASCNVDAFTRYSGPAVSSIPTPALPNGTQAYVMANGAGYGPITVAAGAVALPAGVTTTAAVVGLYYEGTFQSVKLGFAAAMTALAQRKRIDRVGIAVADTHHKALSIGSDENYLDDLPAMIKEEIVPNDRVWSQEDFEMTPINGTWSEDERLVIKAKAPYSATVQGVIIGMASHDAA